MKEAMEFVAKWNDASAKDGLNRTLQKMAEEIADEVEERTAKKAAKNNTIEIAKNLLLYSEEPNIEYIKKATGLSEKAINKLQKKINY